ncbi:unnamed protein product, partial [marine sediment metagenome]
YPSFIWFSNTNLAFNIFSWLVSDYRIELHSSGAIPEIAPQESFTTQTMEYQTPPISSAKTERNINFSMKISNKSELIDLLKIFQNQIDTMKIY